MQRQSRAAEYPARSSFTVDGRERDCMLGPVVRACFRYRFDTAHLRCAVRRAAVAESAAAAVRAVTQTSNRFAAFVDEASERFSVPVNWIGSVINIESAGDVHARSPKGAMGLMQCRRHGQNCASAIISAAIPTTRATTFWQARHICVNCSTDMVARRICRVQCGTSSLRRAYRGRRIARRDASVCGQACNSAWHRVASDADHRPAVIDSCNVVRRAIRSDEDTRSVVGAHSFKRRHDRNLGAPCFALGTSAYWGVRPSIGFGSVALTRCAGSQAMACFSEQLAEGGEQWANTTAGRPPVIGLLQNLRRRSRWSAR
ncbi:hypothetical protein ACVWXL_009057 [Bradyrhizobium sp. GM22.5]